MNARQKLQNTLDFVPGAAAPNWEFSYWYDAVARWYMEGLPRQSLLKQIPYCQYVPAEGCPLPDGFWEESVYPADVSRYFEMDERIHSIGISLAPQPGFASEVLSEDDETITMRASDGKVLQTRKDGTSMPHYLEYPVKEEKDFDAFIERFNPASPERFPNWSDQVVRYKHRSFPLQLGGGAFSGFYSTLRELLGVERSLMEFYMNPKFCRRILDYYLNFLSEVYAKVLAEVEVDYILFWEDLAFKTGPLISPDIFREFIAPCYRTFINRMKELSVRHFIVDTDGNFLVLADLFIEAGVTGFYPFEVAAGMDVVAFRKKYPDIVMMGGIDKRVLSQGPRAIDAELTKVAAVLKTGGYIPYTDHMVPPDVSLENFRYYRGRLKELYGRLTE